MTLGSLFAFNMALLAAIVSPGPALLVAIRTTLSRGSSAGIGIGIGLGTMASIWTLAALLGLDAVFRVFPWAYATVKTVGAGYLLFIAFAMWRNARSQVESRQNFARSAVAQGLLINFLNPKSVLFAAAVLVVVFPPNMTAIENATVVANHLLVEIIFYTLLAFGMSSRLIATAYMRIRVYLDRIASVILGALGVRLLLDR